MIDPPIRPMLAEAVDSIPPDMMYEPKWDGWRCLCFVRAGVVRLFSRRGTDLTSDFPELVQACRAQLPDDCVLDGEIVVLAGHRLEYSQLARRHASGARASRLAREMPASYVVFDTLAIGDRDCRQAAQVVRRELLEQVMADTRAPLILTPCTQDRRTAEEWFDELEAFGMDGVVAKPPRLPYLEGARSVYKIKHRRTADVVVGGYRWDRNATDRTPILGSLLLGAFDAAHDEPQLHFLGVSAGFPQDTRVALAQMLGELEVPPDSAAHPWRDGAPGDSRLPDSAVGWGRGQQRVRLIEPLLVCEVTFDALHPDPTGLRFRSNASFLRWRPDKDPMDCRLDTLVREVPDSTAGLRDWLGARSVPPEQRVDGPHETGGRTFP